MKFIDLNDIEEVVLSKFTIETYLLNSKQIEQKQHIQDYISEIANNMWTVIVDGKNAISFGLKVIPDETFVYVVDMNEQSIKTIEDILNKVNSDTSKFMTVQTRDTDNQKYLFVHKNKYYKI